jgi:hypothetical protein
VEEGVFAHVKHHIGCHLIFIGVRLLKSGALADVAWVAVVSFKEIDEVVKIDLGQFLPNTRVVTSGYKSGSLGVASGYKSGNLGVASGYKGGVLCIIVRGWF